MAAFVQFTDTDDATGQTRTVVVRPAQVALIYQGFDAHHKTAIVAGGVTQWVAAPLATVQAKIAAALD